MTVSLVRARPEGQSPLDCYKERFGDVRGFFQDEAIAIWDFLLAAQREHNIVGNFLEIGVFEGKSAGLGAVHLRPEEACILIDINDIAPVVARIMELGIRTESHTGRRSDSPWVAQSLKDYEGTARWIHIDGAHDGFTTASDLRLAERFLGERGIICVDDFFNARYPQLTSAVYKFLFDNAPIYQMVLCGMNKGYIVRSADYVLYRDLIASELAPHMNAVGFDVTLAKTSYAHDYGCFSVVFRQSDSDIIGRDEDPSDIPF